MLASHEPLNQVFALEPMFVLVVVYYLYIYVLGCYCLPFHINLSIPIPYYASLDDEYTYHLSFYSRVLQCYSLLLILSLYLLVVKTFLCT
jgi:hypothetical protein